MRRLGSSFGGRVGWIGALVVAAGFSAAAARGDEVLVPTARLLCWLAAGPVALAAARSPAERDRADGIELMVALRGVTAARQRQVRIAAATFASMLRVVFAVLLVAVTTLVVRPSGLAAGRAAMVVLLAVAFAAVIGALGALCGEIAGARGRSVLLGLVLVPWLLGDVWSLHNISVVHAIDAGWSLLAKVTPW